MKKIDCHSTPLQSKQLQEALREMDMSTDDDGTIVGLSAKIVGGESVGNIVVSVSS